MVLPELATRQKIAKVLGVELPSTDPPPPPEPPVPEPVPQTVLSTVPSNPPAQSMKRSSMPASFRLLLDVADHLSDADQKRLFWYWTKSVYSGTWRASVSRPVFLHNLNNPQATIAITLLASQSGHQSLHQRLTRPSTMKGTFR
jgi:hypothetical protein